MDLLRRLSLRNAGIEIVKRTVTEEFPEKGNENRWNNSNNNERNAKELGWNHRKDRNHLQQKENIDAINQINDNDSYYGDEDDYIVIELLDEEQDESRDFSNEEDFVDINMQSSKQVLLFLAKKKRGFITYRSRAVSSAPMLKRFSTAPIVIFLRPFFRLTISPTKQWYVNHRASLLISHRHDGCKTRPVHYTEKVECVNDGFGVQNERRAGDISGVQLIFSDEAKNEVSKLTLSSDFTTSYEEKHSKLAEISRDIEISDDDHKPLRRSYSIEFLNESGDDEISFSAENVARKIEEGDVRDVYDDSVDDSLQQSNLYGDETHEKSILKRSFSIEFLNEDEDKPLSSEMVHYKMDKGEGVLVYSDIDVMDNSKILETEKPRKRAYSIEFLNENEENRSGFTYETVSNKIEKGEGRHVYDDDEISYDSHSNWHKRPVEKLKTLGVKMEIEDDGEALPVSLLKQHKAYSIELLHERDDGYDDDHGDYDDDHGDYDDDHGDYGNEEEEIVPSQFAADESALENDFLDQLEELDLERRSFNVEFLDEKPDLNLDLNDPESLKKSSSTPLKNSLNSPKKSPLETVRIGVEFEKRNKSETDGGELFMNEAEEYLVYEGKSAAENGTSERSGRHRIPSFKLQTVVINMDTHHQRKRNSLFQNKQFKLEFQTERERRISMLREAQKARIPSDSAASIRTVSIENDAEEVLHDENELRPPELLKRKAYSVEYLNETEGDRSVFVEEFVDEGEPRWALEI